VLTQSTILSLTGFHAKDASAAASTIGILSYNSGVNQQWRKEGELYKLKGSGSREKVRRSLGLN